MMTKNKKRIIKLEAELAELEAQYDEALNDIKYWEEDAEHSLQMYIQLRQSMTQLRWYEKLLRKVFS